MQNYWVNFEELGESIIMDAKKKVRKYYKVGIVHVIGLINGHITTVQAEVIVIYSPPSCEGGRILSSIDFDNASVLGERNNPKWHQVYITIPTQEPF